MKFYQDNHYDEQSNVLLNKSKTEKLDNQLIKLFTPQPYFERWRIFHLCTIGLSYICNLLSLITALSILTYLVWNSIPIQNTSTLILALIISSILVVVLELLKRHSLNNLIKSIFQFKKAGIVLISISLICCSFSVVLSFYGANKLPSMIQEKNSQSINLINIDSIKIHYNEVISQKRSAIDNIRLENKSKNGRIYASKAIEAISNLEQSIIDTEHNLNHEITKAKKTNENSKSDNQKLVNDELNSLKKSLGYLALGIEILFIMCIVFNWYYYYQSYLCRCSKDALGDAPGGAPGDALGTNKTTINSTLQDDAPIAPPGARPIVKGFNNDNRLDDNSHNRTCLHCGKSYTYKHVKQKYCSDSCRKKSWQEKTGKKLAFKKSRVKAEI